MDRICATVKMDLSEDLLELETPYLRSCSKSCNWFKQLPEPRDISYKLANHLIIFDPTSVWNMNGDPEIMDGLYISAITQDPTVILFYYIKDYPLVRSGALNNIVLMRDDPMDRYLKYAFSLDATLLGYFPKVTYGVFDCWKEYFINLDDISEDLLDRFDNHMIHELMITYQYSKHAMLLFEYALRKGYSIPNQCQNELFRLSPLSILDGSFDDSMWDYCCGLVIERNMLHNNSESHAMFRFCIECMSKIDDDERRLKIEQFLKSNLLTGTTNNIEYRLESLESVGIVISTETFGYSAITSELAATCVRMPRKYFAKIVADKLKLITDHDLNEITSFESLATPFPNEHFAIHVYCMNNGIDDDVFFNEIKGEL